MAANEYGRYYYCVEFEKGHGGAVYLHADAVKVNENGDLLFISAGRRKVGSDPDGDDSIWFAVSAGKWRTFYAANVMDGGAVSVEHWEGVHKPKPSKG